MAGQLYMPDSGEQTAPTFDGSARGLRSYFHILETLFDQRPYLTEQEKKKHAVVYLDFKPAKQWQNLTATTFATETVTYEQWKKSIFKLYPRATMSMRELEQLVGKWMVSKIRTKENLAEYYRDFCWIANEMQPTPSAYAQQEYFQRAFSQKLMQLTQTRLYLLYPNNDPESHVCPVETIYSAASAVLRRENVTLVAQMPGAFIPSAYPRVSPVLSPESVLSPSATLNKPPTEPQIKIGDIELITRHAIRAELTPLLAQLASVTSIPATMRPQSTASVPQPSSTLEADSSSSTSSSEFATPLPHCPLTSPGSSTHSLVSLQPSLQTLPTDPQPTSRVPTNSTMEERRYMPDFGDETAPTFNGSARDVRSYFYRLERLFKHRPYLTEQEKKKFAIGYLGYETAGKWQSITATTFATDTVTYKQWKKSILKFYPGATPGIRELKEMIQKWAMSEIRTKEDLAEYYRDFCGISGYIQPAFCAYTQQEYFQKAFPPTLMELTETRLDLLHPNNDPETHVYPIETIYEAASAVLRPGNGVSEPQMPSTVTRIAYPQVSSALSPGLAPPHPVEPPTEPQIKIEDIKAIRQVVRDELKPLVAQITSIAAAPSTSIPATTRRQNKACPFCGALGHNMKLCTIIPQYISDNRCKRGPDNRLVMPDGSVIPRGNPGEPLAQRINTKLQLSPWQHRSR